MSGINNLFYLSIQFFYVVFRCLFKFLHFIDIRLLLTLIYSVLHSDYSNKFLF